jgi:hypothetical protein
VGGNIDKNYYYAVTAANSVTESIASDIVGKYDLKLVTNSKRQF